jgi:hypothetical protein
LGTDRLDLLAALLSEMRRQHVKAVETLVREAPFRRHLVCGPDAEFMLGLMPPVPSAMVHIIETTPVLGIARLFE